MHMHTHAHTHSCSMQRFHLDSIHIGCVWWICYACLPFTFFSLICLAVHVVCWLLCLVLLWACDCYSTNTVYEHHTIWYINPFIFIEYAFMFIMNGRESRHHNHNYHAVDTNWSTHTNTYSRTNVWKVELHFICVLLTWKRLEWRYEKTEKNAQCVCAYISVHLFILAHLVSMEL